MRKGNRILSGLLALVMAAVMLLCPAAAISYEPDFTPTSKAVYLENLDTGLILYEKNADEKMYPASLTKIMTAIVVLENVKDLDGETAEYPMWIQNMLYGTNASLGGLIVGEELTIRQLLTSALVQSGNESAMILAGYVGSGGMADFMPRDITTFVEMMNDKAKALGCTGTHFTNPTGLHSDNTYTTARDMAIMAKYAMQKSAFSSIVKNYAVQLGQTNKHADLWQYSTNKMLLTSSPYYYAPVVGIKTGSTDAAGQCLVSSAVRGSRTLISVVLGAEKVEKENGSGYIVESFTETARLFDWGFDNFAPQQVLDENELIQEVPVALSKQVSTVAVHPAESADAMLPKDLDVSALTRTVTLDNETALAPIAAGDRLGEITVSYGDTTYVTVPLLAVADVSASRFLLAKHAIVQFFSRTPVKIAAIVLVVLVIAVLLWFRLYGRTRRYGRASSKRYRQHTYHGRRR